MLFNFCIALFLSAGSVWAQSLTTQEKLNDFDQLNFMIESMYGPYQYKQEALSLDLPLMKKTYRALVRKTKTNNDFYYLLVKYVASFRDGHFYTYVPSEYSRSIPVMTELVEGKVLIDTIERNKLNKTKFPFDRGDEIVTVDGQSIEAFLNEYKAYVATGNPKSQLRVASHLIFMRPAWLVPAPTENITVGIRTSGSTRVQNVTLKWQDEGIKLDEKRITPPFQSLVRTGGHNRKGMTQFSNLSSRDNYERYYGGRQRLERSYQCAGSTRVKIPNGATMVMTEPFVAYYHSTPMGKVGYLRIPHYDWADEANPNFEQEIFQKYVYAIDEFEKHTVGLIIDQDHNCGGSVDLLEQMVSLFIEKPVDPLQFRIRANKKNYVDLITFNEEVPTDTIFYKFIEGLQVMVKAAWTRGDFMTSKVGFTGTKIYPSPIRYSKPIVMTIDEMAGSGGDAFPALMQGYGRAVLVGQRTAGMGGHISEMPDLNNSAMKIQMTQSLFYRPDGVAVENNGAEPDVEYVTTRDDFMNQYRDYQKFYLQVLFDQIDKNPKPRR